MCAYRYGWWWWPVGRAAVHASAVVSAVLERQWHGVASACAFSQELSLATLLVTCGCSAGDEEFVDDLGALQI